MKRTTNTGVKGISLRKNGKYEASVRFPKNREGVQHKFHVGTFTDLKAAHQAREKFILKLI